MINSSKIKPHIPTFIAVAMVLITIALYFFPFSTGLGMSLFDILESNSRYIDTLIIDAELFHYLIADDMIPSVVIFPIVTICIFVLMFLIGAILIFFVKRHQKVLYYYYLPFIISIILCAIYYFQEYKYNNYGSFYPLAVFSLALIFIYSLILLYFKATKTNLGYSEFIDKHCKILFPSFLMALTSSMFTPIYYSALVRNQPSILSMFFDTFKINKDLQLRYALESSFSSISFADFYSANIKNYAPQITACILVLILLICTIIFLIIFYKKQCSVLVLIWLPLTLLLAFEIIFVGIASSNPIHLFFILTAILLVLLYKYKFQRFPHLSYKPRPHKPTKSERIAELERQIAELKSTQNSTDEEILP